MIYGHQIKQTDAFNTNLDNGISILKFGKIIVIVKLFFDNAGFLFFNILSLSIQSNGTTVISTTHHRQQSIPCCFMSLSSLLLLILLLYSICQPCRQFLSCRLYMWCFLLSATKLSSNLILSGLYCRKNLNTSYKYRLPSFMPSKILIAKLCQVKIPIVKLCRVLCRVKC